MRWIPLLCLFALAFSSGCSQPSATFNKVGKADYDRSAIAQRPLEENANGEPAMKQAAILAGDNGGKKPKQEPAKEKPRKIRYTAEMRLVVEKLDDAETALEAAAKDAKGEFAKAETSSSANAVRTGVWRIRVPADNLQAFRKAIAKIGEVERNILDSEDLTAQYYDLEAHIKNRKDARETLRELLKETGKKDMKHYIEVWDKLEQITDEINRKEGQLKLWANLTDLTTMTVYMREKQPYDPAKVVDREIPTFGTRAGTSWHRSWETLLEFCQGVVLFVIILAPWLPLLLVGFIGFWLVARRLARPAEPIMLAEAPAAVQPTTGDKK